MVSVQLAPAPRVAGQFLAKGKSALLVPVTPMLVIESGPVPALVIVTVLGLLHLFTTSLPILRAVWDKETPPVNLAQRPSTVSVTHSSPLPSHSNTTCPLLLAPKTSGL